MESEPYVKAGDVERTYRSLTAPDLLKRRMVAGESDLMILASADIYDLALRKLKSIRTELKEYIHLHPLFKETLEAYPEDDNAPSVIQNMIAASRAVHVGPMAAVAGAIAGAIGRSIPATISELIIENGGDIYIRTSKKRTIAIFAGTSVLSGKIGLIIPPGIELGVCTSSGTVGPSLSFGRADAVVVLSSDPALADAAATAIGNRIRSTEDLANAVKYAQSIPEIEGVLCIKDDHLAVWGRVELTPLEKNSSK